MKSTPLLALAIAAAALAAPFNAVSAAPAPAAAPPSAVTPAAASVTITFAGIELPQGRIMVALYDGKQAYEGGSPVRVAPVAVSGTGEVSATIEGLAPGAYAVKAFHDVDGDGKLGKNPFGIPTEPYAFSNDAKGERGPASWEAASFALAAGANAQRITLR
ncbi:MAG: hypothetical protein JWO25_1269 [Alphaproteobacteria bacterium]|nr:hypothetical protein [Alphaproteobacteria bacterium]